MRAAPAHDLKVRRHFFEELQVYQTEDSVLQLQSFKIKYKPPTAYQAEPCVLLTISKLEVKVFFESLMDKEMRFTCLKTIRLTSRLSSIEALFIERKPHEPPQLTTNKVESHHLSKIFDTYRDEELKCKQKNNSSHFGSL